MSEPAGPTPADYAEPWARPEASGKPLQARRRVLVFALLGILAYCAGLIAMIPASLVLPRSELWQVGGTIWNGEAVIGGASRLEWHWSAPASLRRLALAANWHLTGGATDLIGTASPGFHRLRLDNVSGVADATLLDALAPNLPVTCRFLAQVALARVVIGGNDQQATGSLRSSPLHCTAKALATAALDLPALHGVIGPAHGLSSGALFTLPSRQHLIEARLSNTGAFSLWPTAALTARVPALAGTRLDTTGRW